MQPLSYEDRLALTKLVMALLDQWGVPAADQIAVLALPAETRTRHLKRYSEDTPLPDDPKVMERVEHLAGIAEALRTTHPRNAHMATRWLNRPHRRFQQRTPLALMVQDGLDGLRAVRADLDCTYAWSRSEEKA